MNRKPLKSSQLRAAGYDESLRVMEIEFVNGDIYEYKAVSPELFRQLMSSPSPNSFFEDKRGACKTFFDVECAAITRDFYRD